MQINFLKHLVEKIAGPAAVPIVEILYLKHDVNEFLIAKKMEMTINQVRNVLYKLSAEGLVSFIRKKDKRKGWYIYFWTLNSHKCLIKIELDILNEIEDLKGLLNSRENNRFYICKTCDIELSEEKALEHDFSCEECADLYELADNTLIIKDLKNKIIRKERDLTNIKEELKLVEEEENKKKIAKQKKHEKEKLAEKEKKKLARKKEKELINKDPSKKSKSIKVVKKPLKKKIKPVTKKLKNK
jgi:transcription factor E